MEALNEEFENFFQKCKKQEFFKEEMSELCEIINSHKSKWKILKIYIIISALILSIVTYNYADYMDWLTWPLSAVGKLIMIKLLPFYDWTYLYNTKCLIPKNVNGNHLTNNIPKISKYETDASNCLLCENLGNINKFFKF